jgi:hypothetical protein
MAKSMNYDHPQYIAHQFTALHIPATTASQPAAKFPAHVAMKVKRISGCVVVAGTNDSAGYVVLIGTTSVGAITFGTNTAGSFVSGLTQDITLSSGGNLGFSTKANSATMVTDLMIEFQVIPGADVTS